MILSDEFWSTIDQNKDGELDANEFGSVRIALDQDVIFATPWLVYPPIETEYHSLFEVEGTKSDSNALFALHPTQKFALPFTQENWQKWLQSQTNETSGFSLSLPKSSDTSLRSNLAAMGPVTVPESKKYVIPFATHRNEHVSLTKHVHLSERVFFADATHGIAKNLFKSTFEIHAMRQLPDVIHIFNKDPNDKEKEQEALERGTDELTQDSNDDFPMSSMAQAHLGKVAKGRVKYTCSPTPLIENLKPGGCVISDDTSVLVYGVVRFPASRTQEYLCGVPRAVISVYEIIDGVVANEGDYIYADDLGFFNFAATPGTSWKFVATYRGPDSKARKGAGPEFEPRTDRKLCYAGNKYDDAMQDSSCKNEAAYTTSFVLNEVVGGETIVFMDVTERIIDLGLFAGACEDTYTGYSFLISPANGCGSSFTITDADLELPKFKESALITKYNSPTVRKWPYAAMDYYIQLDEAPDVSALTETKLVNWESSNGLKGGKKFVGASCKPPGSDIMQFFRDRDALVRTLLLLNPKEESNDIIHDDAKYAYHGWFCATPYLNDIDTQDPDPAKDPFYVITSKDDVCLGDNNNDLREKNLIGVTNAMYSKLKNPVVDKKYVSMRVMEAHLTSKDEISTCSTFESPTSENLKVTVRLQQDIGPEGDKNPCHSSSLPSDDCVFSKVDAETHFLNFKQPASDATEHEVDDSSKFYTIDADGAIPNLVAPYRRKVLARLQRDDGWAVTNLEVQRELVTMQSKVRGGGNDKSARYQSAVEFYATAPVRGLVYTVVHDPPGGDSVASISKGTEVSLALSLASTRAATGSMGFGFKAGIETELKFTPKVDAGSSYINALIDLDPNKAGADLGENQGRRHLLESSEGGRFKMMPIMKSVPVHKDEPIYEMRDVYEDRKRVEKVYLDNKKTSSIRKSNEKGDFGRFGGYKVQESGHEYRRGHGQQEFERREITERVKVGEEKVQIGTRKVKVGDKKVLDFAKIPLKEKKPDPDRPTPDPPTPDPTPPIGNIIPKVGEEKAGKPEGGKGPITFKTETGASLSINGPSVSVNSGVNDGWDFSMTLSRNVESSADPGIPGRSGDTILGGGFEIVYVKTDVVDIRLLPAEISEGEQKSDWFDCKDADDIEPDVVITRGDGIDGSAAYSHEAYKFMKDKMVRMSTANHYFTTVNFKNAEKKDFCYSIQFKVTQKDVAEKKQCRVEYFAPKKKSGECSSYDKSDKTFGQPTEPSEEYKIATADGAEGIGLKEFYYLSKSKSKDSKAPSCLTVVPQVQWLPRKPTTYLSTIFTIETRVIPELEGLIKVANDPNSLMSDDSISESTNIPQVLKIKEIWKGRLKQSISDWKYTLELVSPDYHPEGLLAKSDKDQKAYLKGIDLKWSKDINAALSSDESVFGTLSKDKVKEVYKRPAEGMTLSTDIHDTDVWKDVQQTWDEIGPKKYLSIVPGLKEAMTLGGKVPTLKDLPVAAMLKTESFILTPGDEIPLYSHPLNMVNYAQTMIDAATSIFGNEKGGDVATTADSWMKTLTPDEPGFYSRGMDDVPDSENLIDASVYGSTAPFTFAKNPKTKSSEYSPLDDHPEPKLGGPQADIYLTFSGGGHSISFSQSVNDNIAGGDYSWGISLEAGLAFEGTRDFSVSILSVGDNGNVEVQATTDATRNVAWAKYGSLETSYSLGDPDPYDKFVIRVSTDKRFGTPTFKTIGGASKCPGEPDTMWRESGMILQTEWSPGVNNEFIPPGDDALYDLIITNESPYREGMSYGLVLTTGETWKGADGANMRDLSFSVSNVGGLSILGSMTPLDSVNSVNNDGDLVHTVMTMRVSKGVFADKYTDIGVMLVSACEFSSDWMYRDPISSTAYLGDMKWERECPPVQWDETTVNKYLNKKVHAQSWPVLNYTVLNPNPVNLWTKDKGTQEGKYDHLVHENVEFVRIQWRKLNEGEWINAWNDDKSDADVQCDTARGQGCKLPWNIENQYFMNGLRDGTWEIRAKVFCSGYDSFAAAGVKYSSTEDNLNLIVDANQPLAVDASILNDVFKVDFSEPLACPQLAPSQMPYQIRHVKTCDGSNIDSNVGSFSAEAVINTFSFVCMNGDGKGSLVAKFPGNVGEGSYELTVNPFLYKAKTSEERKKLLADVNGNPVATAKYTTTFGCKGADASSSKAATLTSTLGLLRENSTNEKKKRNIKDIDEFRNAELGENMKTSTTMKTTTLLFGFCATVVLTASVVFAAVSPSARSEGGERKSAMMRLFGRRQSHSSRDEDDALLEQSSINSNVYGSVI